MEFSINVREYFTEEELTDYVERARWSLDIEEPFEVNWVEDREGTGNGEWVVNRGNYIIADGLEELQAYVLLDELQGIFGEEV